MEYLNIADFYPDIGHYINTTRVCFQLLYDQLVVWGAFSSNQQPPLTTEVSLIFQNKQTNKQTP